MKFKEVTIYHSEIRKILGIQLGALIKILGIQLGALISGNKLNLKLKRRKLGIQLEALKIDNYSNEIKTIFAFIRHTKRYKKRRLQIQLGALNIYDY